MAGKKLERPKPWGMPAMTHAEIAAELGVSGSRIEQIERRALQKLRAEMERLGLTIEDFFD